MTSKDRQECPDNTSNARETLPTSEAGRAADGMDMSREAASPWLATLRRRDFLRLAGGLGLGLLAGGIPFPRTARAITEHEIETLPLGVADAAKRDWALAVAYAYYARDGWESVGN